MTDPLSFPSTTVRHALPLLFVGQAQKEFTVNAAHALADILLHPAVDGIANVPPANSIEGSCWLVGAQPTGIFAGRAGELAGFQAGTWLFATPRDGMRIFDRSTGQHVLYANGWRRVEAPAQPLGGAVIDAEARGTIAALIAALTAAGVFPDS